jgi:hypothetical protein
MSVKQEAASEELKQLSDEKAKLLGKGWQTLTPEQKKRTGYLGREIKRILRNDMENHLTTLCSEIDQACKEGNHKLVSQTLEKLRGTSNKKRAPPIDMDEMNSHFKKTCNPPRNVTDESKEKLLQEIREHIARRDLPRINGETPTFEEVSVALASIKGGKAVGPDGIPIELLYASGESGALHVHKMISQIWNDGKCPKEWLITEVVPLFKGKGDPKSPDNYRGISLQPHICKVLSKIILNRLNPLI